MSRKNRVLSILVDEAYPVSLRVYRTSRGLYRWDIEVKASSIQEAESSIEKIDEWCRMKFMAPSAKAGDVATSKPSEIDSLPSELAFSIKYRGHNLGKIILDHDKTIVKIDDSCRIKLGDPAISSFLIRKVVYPICDRLQAKWNPIEVDGYLREIVIDKPLSGEDADEFIKSARWAITKAFSKPMEKKNGGGKNE
ncbi:MAG: hypothetical protein LZ174_09025 [Thaumarchaeota archaeon]|nr:hypothetical protein [Candidatus Geocrenenecus arthurdayi]